MHAVGGRGFLGQIRCAKRDDKGMGVKETGMAHKSEVR